MIPGISAAFLAYSIISFIDLSFTEFIPLYCVTSVNMGGLGIQKEYIPFVMAFTGCLQICYSFVIYPLLVGQLGQVQCFRTGLIAFIPFCLGLSYLNYFHSESIVQFVFLVFMFSFSRVCCALGNASIGIIINHCVQREQRGSINGLSMAIGSLAKVRD
jgi:Na+/melibiose symporter-like transporter